MILENTFGGIFKGKKVFVTGHTGFIGTWLSLWLTSLDAKVVGYSLGSPTNPSMFEIVKSEKYLTHIIGDVRDANNLQESLYKNNPEFVIHLAAQPLVRLSYDKPVETFQTNIMGTANVLEAIRQVPSVRVCIIMTSDKCYENRESLYAYKENDPMGGHDPYSASKGAAELITASYRNSFFNPNSIDKHNVSVSTIRAGNVIGGGDWATDRIVPDCIRALISRKSINVRYPNAIRPWQYVLEPISGILSLAMKMWKDPAVYSGAWNFGPLASNNITVKELVDNIIEKWGDGNWIDVSKQVNSLPHEASSLMLDSTKAKQLGWQPVYSIEEAIMETISWYLSYVNKTDEMDDITFMQINRYTEKAKQMNIVWGDDSYILGCKS